MPDYALSKIYKIVNSENSKVYIGSTTRKYLSDRMANHRSAAREGVVTACFYKAMRKIGIDKFTIELIKEYPCFDKKELEVEEFRIIRKVIKRGVSLYNTITDQGVLPESVRILRSKGRCRRGCVRFERLFGNWTFAWCPEIGKRKKRSFSVNKYGAEEAENMVIAFQDSIYPKI